MDNDWNASGQDQERKEEQPGTPVGQPQQELFTQWQEHRELKHSGPGIASFVVFLVMFAAFLGLIVAFTAQLGINPDRVVNPEDIQREVEHSPVLFIIPLLLMGTVLGYVIGLVLGIIGLVQKERKKVFAILGTVLNGLAVGLFALLVLIGILIRTAV